MTQILLIGTSAAGRTDLVRALSLLAMQNCEPIIVGRESSNNELLRELFARQSEPLPNLEVLKRRDKIIADSKAKHAAKEARRAKRFK